MFAASRLSACTKLRRLQVPCCSSALYPKRLISLEASIRSKLTSSLQPLALEIINESYMHNVPKGSESHFKVFIVSDQFEHKSLVQMHRIVHDILKNELVGGVHALSIVAKAPSQWNGLEQTESSPPCRGGAGL